MAQPPTLLWKDFPGLLRKKYSKDQRAGLKRKIAKNAKRNKNFLLKSASLKISFAFSHIILSYHFLNFFGHQQAFIEYQFFCEFSSTQNFNCRHFVSFCFYKPRSDQCLWGNFVARFKHPFQVE